MFLKKVQGKNFRNYKNFSVEFPSLITVLNGENGEGKSSLLEALYCCLRGKSFYSFIGPNFINNKESKAQVFLTVEEDQGMSQIEARFYREGLRLKKEMFYCKKKTTASFLEKKFPVFVFTEETMKCIRQGADQRRAFIDNFFVCGPNKQIKDKFYKVLKQKRSLLKDINRGLESVKESYKTLQALDCIFIEASTDLIKIRQELLIKLFSNLKTLKNEFFKDPVPVLSFSYLFSKDQALLEDSNIQALLEKDLERMRKKEIQAGLPLFGPQKHEIQFLFNGQDSRVFCSKGQQRAFILSLLGSHICRFPGASLFLDDVLLELDEKTQNKFLEFLEKNHCQTFLTNCKVISLKTKKMSFFDIKNGIIKRQQ